MDLFENAVFMLPCGRVKLRGEKELFENADVTVSIYDVSEHAHGSLGIAQGHFDCSFHSFILKYLYRYKFHIFIHVFQTDLLKNNIK